MPAPVSPWPVKFHFITYLDMLLLWTGPLQMPIRCESPNAGQRLHSEFLSWLDVLALRVQNRRSRQASQTGIQTTCTAFAWVFWVVACRLATQPARLGSPCLGGNACEIRRQWMRASQFQTFGNHLT